jgi:uncharacterized membrane protein YedE/YeeE
MLHDQLAWYIGGPILGLCVVAIRALLGERLGATGAWSSAVESALSRRLSLDWRGYLLIGLIAGGLTFALIAGGPDFHGYGWLTDTFTGDSRFLVGPILVVAGILIGFGAKTARGCTSGNGLSGTAIWSPASLVATATFFGTAIGVSFLTEALI